VSSPQLLAQAHATNSEATAKRRGRMLFFIQGHDDNGRCQVTARGGDLGLLFRRNSRSTFEISES
jgi:hypothetical protein